jgi:hypothetical protein
MLDLSEYFHEEAINECSKEELQALVRVLIRRLEYEMMLHNESITDKRWLRKACEEDRHKHRWKESYWNDENKKLRTELEVKEKILEAYRKQYPQKKKTIN